VTLILGELGQVKAFFSRSKHLLGFTIFITMLTFGIKIVYLDYSIDTEVLMTRYASQLHAWQSIGRFGLVGLKKLLLPSNYVNVYFLNFLTYTLFVLSVLAICFLLYRIIGPQIPQLALAAIPAVMIPSAINAEQFNFVLQSFEVALVLFIIVGAVYFAWLSFHEHILGGYFVALFGVVLGFGTYQSLVPFFIALTLMIMVLELTINQTGYTIKNYIKFGGYFISLLLLGLISNLLINKVIDVIFHIQATSYLTQLINWGKLPVQQVLRTIVGGMLHTFFPRDNYHSYMLFIEMIALLVLFIFKRQKNKLLLALTTLVLVLSPFLLLIMLGNQPVIRAEMPTYPFVSAFLFFYLLWQVKKQMWLYSAGLLLMFSYSFFASSATANLLFSEHMKYEQDVQLANRVQQQIDNLHLDHSNEYALYFLGQSPAKGPAIRPVQVLGRSYFEWDSITEAGVSSRASGFMQTLGYIYRPLDEKEIKLARQYANKLTVFPTKNAIKVVGKVIIIRLS